MANFTSDYNKDSIKCCIENQLEFLYSDDERFSEFIDNLPQKEYEQMFEKLFENILEDDELWKKFDEIVEWYVYHDTPFSEKLREDY